MVKLELGGKLLAARLHSVLCTRLHVHPSLFLGITSGSCLDASCCLAPVPPDLCHAHCTRHWVVKRKKGKWPVLANNAIRVQMLQ